LSGLLLAGCTTLRGHMATTYPRFEGAEKLADELHDESARADLARLGDAHDFNEATLALVNSCIYDALVAARKERHLPAALTEQRDARALVDLVETARGCSVGCALSARDRDILPRDRELAARYGGRCDDRLTRYGAAADLASLEVEVHGLEDDGARGRYFEMRRRLARLDSALDETLARHPERAAPVEALRRRVALCRKRYAGKLSLTDQYDRDPEVLELAARRRRLTDEVSQVVGALNQLERGQGGVQEMQYARWRLLHRQRDVLQAEIDAVDKRLEERRRALGL
jgi:hypothetical protein